MGCRFGGLACIGEPKSARGGRPIACRASRTGAAKVGVKEKAAEGVSLRLGRITTRGLLQGVAVVKACRWSSNLTRPVSWLGPETSGTHPRTKGTRCFAGGYRRRVPWTRGVS